jgi:hypothetical protein
MTGASGTEARRCSHFEAKRRLRLRVCCGTLGGGVFRSAGEFSANSLNANCGVRGTQVNRNRDRRRRGGGFLSSSLDSA